MASKYGGIAVKTQSKFGGIPVSSVSADIGQDDDVPDIDLTALQPQTVDSEIQKTIQTQDPKTALAKIESMFQKIPGAPTLSEFAAGFNREALGALDFLGPDTLNAIAGLIGVDAKVPSLEESFGSEGGFMDPGLARDVVATAGEVVPLALGMGAGVRQAASKLPTLAAGGESTAAGLLRSAGQSGPVADVGFGAASGAGQEIGEEQGGPAGGLLGAFAAPAIAQAGVSTLKGLIGLGGKGFQILSKSIENLSDEGAGQLLAEAMVREGISPEDFAKQLSQLGPEAIPADVGNNFARLLRVASNKVPRIEGRAHDTLRQRQAGQSDRILDALDDAGGTSSLNVTDEIERLNTTLGPKINDLYRQAGDQPIHGSKRLRTLLEGDNSVGKALNKAQLRISDKRAAGDTITNIDVIDATKQQLDDQIGLALRQGEKNTVRDLVRLKNIMVDEVDIAAPVYKEARDLFAGKAQLENAADAGTLFFKMKPREIGAFTKTYGASEKKMFKLGAKQAIIDKIENLQTNANAVKRLFGKNGDVKKLQSLFDDKEAFNRFSDTLERESQFILTRNAAQANSTTAKQLADEGTAEEIIGATMSLLGSPMQSATAFGRILSGLSGKKTGAVFAQSLEKAGDILLTKGMKPEKIQAMLRRGNPNEVEAALRKIMIRPNETITGATAGALELMDQ